LLPALHGRKKERKASIGLEYNWQKTTVQALASNENEAAWYQFNTTLTPLRRNFCSNIFANNNVIYLFLSTLRDLFHKQVTKRHHSVNFQNVKIRTYTFCREFIGGDIIFMTTSL